MKAVCTLCVPRKQGRELHPPGLSARGYEPRKRLLLTSLQSLWAESNSRKPIS